jgi:hypothetical protein
MRPIYPTFVMAALLLSAPLSAIELTTTWQTTSAAKSTTGAASWKAAAAERGELPATAVPPEPLPLWVSTATKQAPSFFHARAVLRKKAVKK